MHSQHFAESGLVGWHDGPCENEPNVVVRRSLAMDEADILSRGVVPPGASAVIRAQTGESLDVFLIGRELNRQVPDILHELSIHLILHAADTPWGDAERRYVVSGTSLSPVDDETASWIPDVRISGPHEALLRWLHCGSPELGPILLAGGAQGDIARISAASGILCDLRFTSEAERKDAEQLVDDFVSWSVRRSLPQSIRVFDRIEESTV